MTQPAAVQCVNPIGIKYTAISSAIHIFNSIVLDDYTRLYAEKLDEHYWGTKAIYSAYFKEVGGEIMDFGTIRTNIKNGKYKDECMLFDDMELVFKNAIKYNGSANKWGVEAQRLQKILYCLKNKLIIEKIAFVPSNDKCRSCAKCNNILIPSKNHNITAIRCSHCAEKINGQRIEPIYTCHNHTDKIHHFCSKCVKEYCSKCGKWNVVDEECQCIVNELIYRLEPNRNQAVKSKKRSFDPSSYHSGRPSHPPKKKAKLQIFEENERKEIIKQSVNDPIMSVRIQKEENKIDKLKKNWNAERKMYDETIKLLKMQKNERLLRLKSKNIEINDLKRTLNKVCDNLKQERQKWDIERTEKNKRNNTLQEELYKLRRKLNALTMEKDEISDSDENDEFNANI